MKRVFKVVPIILIVLLLPICLIIRQSESQVWVFCMLIGIAALLVTRMFEAIIINKYKTRWLIVLNEFVALWVFAKYFYLFTNYPLDIHDYSIEQLIESKTITSRLDIILIVNGLLEAFFHAKWFERKIDDNEFES